jgi:NADH:ubiquinone oxidoreductase subunit
MGIFGKIFTWWNGATLGTMLHSWRTGEKMGHDSLGNVYFQSRAKSKSVASNGRPRRWVIYAGANDASCVPPQWHIWLHHTCDDVPDAGQAGPTWIDAPTPNLTGTAQAYRPAGALENRGPRAKVTGDYVAWTPGEAPQA